MLVLSYSRYTAYNNNNNNNLYNSRSIVEMFKENEKKTPIWFMRQAGRYLPEYRNMRQKKGSFLELCFDPEAAAEVSLQPIRRFDLDFIILFSDILVIPFALGQNLKFIEGEGPVLGDLMAVDKLEKLNFEKCLRKITPVFETLTILKQNKKNKSLIGFCGAPFTVMNYMIEKGTSVSHQKILNFIRNSPKQAERLIHILREISVLYLKKQIKAGAEIIKVFDSWAGILSEREYDKFVIEPNKYKNDEIKKSYPQIRTIFFPRKSGRKVLRFIEQIECDILAIDEVYPKELKIEAEKKDITLQGNLSPEILLLGGLKMEKKIKEILFDFRKNKHIFNLSHGVLPKTPVQNVIKTIETIKNYECNESTSQFT